MKSAVEVIDVLTHQLSVELLAAQNDNEAEVDIKLATAFIKMYFEMLDTNNKLTEEYTNALEALNEYAFIMMKARHNGYTALIVRMTTLMDRIADKDNDDSSASSMTTKEIQLMLFGGIEEKANE